MPDPIPALLHGGTFDERTIILSEPLAVLRMEDYSSGRLAIHRYLFMNVDERGVRHYVSDSIAPTTLS